MRSTEETTIPSTARSYSILDFGAKGDGQTDDAKAIQAAIDGCHNEGGGTVVFPAGNIYLSGPVELRSHVAIYVQTGATLLASPDETVYQTSAFRENKGEGTVWLGAWDVEMVTIEGGGLIDGNGVAFMGAELEDSFELKPFDTVDPRPHLLTMVGGRNIKIRGVTFEDGAYWTLHFIGCSDVSISGITIKNNLKIRNCDGIDLDHSRDVRISNCHIESGDDCICLKNRREYEEFGPCRDITVTGCTLVSTSCAIKLGSENMDDIANVVFDGCIIRGSNRGLGIQNRDEGRIYNIVFSNMIIEGRLFSDVWWGKAEPISITAYPRANNNDKDGNWRFPKGKQVGIVGDVFDILFLNVRCRSENGIYVGGDTAEKVRDIRFVEVDLVIDKTTEHPGGAYDCRPCAGKPMVVGSTSAFYINRASRVSIENCRVRWGQNRPAYFNQPLEAVEAKDLDVTGLKGEPASHGK